jgi:hypothetical protein
VTNEEQKMSRRGPAMLLALLLSVLLGGPVAAVPAAAPTDAKTLHAAKPAGAVRIAERVSDDDLGDPSSSSPALGGSTPVETSRLSSRPASAAARAPTAVRATAPVLPFRARAPPAA